MRAAGHLARRVARRLATTVTVALVAITAAGGCSTAPAHFYTLAATATSDGAPPLATTVMVGPVSVPADDDQPQMVLQVAPNRVEVDEFNRWAAPLNDAVARAVAGDLVVLLGTPDVATAPLANFQPDYWVTIDVQRFESTRAAAAVLEAVWTVRQRAGSHTRTGRTVAREAVAGAGSDAGAGFDALAAAHSRALARLSADIAAAIRALATRYP